MGIEVAAAATWRPRRDRELRVIRLRAGPCRGAGSGARFALAAFGGLRRTRADENCPHRRWPPLPAALRGRHGVGVQPSRDLGQALAYSVLVADASHDLDTESNLAARSRRRSSTRACLSPALGGEALELVDRNEVRAPADLDRLDERHDAACEGRAADAERRCRLGPRVTQPLDVIRFADDYARGVPLDRRSRVTLCLLGSAAETTARHAYNVQQR